MSDKLSHEELEKRILELEQAVSQCRKSEEEFSQIFSISLDMLCVDNINIATFLKVNHAFTEILGYSEEELLGSPFFDFIHPEDIDLTRSVIEEKLLLGEKAINFENRYRCKDGSYQWLSWMSYPNLEQGTTYAVARDITENKLAEQKVLLNQKQLQVISKIGMLANSTLSLDDVLESILKNTIETLDASSGMILLKDPVTGCLSWGASSGLSKAFVSDFQNRPIQPGEGLTGHIAQTGDPIYIALDSSHDPRIERSSITEEGLHSFTGVPLKAADKIVGVMNILTRPPDILSEEDMYICAAVGSHVGMAIQNAKLFDKHKQAEKSLLESEERFKTLSDLTFEGILIHKNGVVIDCNDALTKMLGYSKEELITENIIQLCVPREYHTIIQENVSISYAKPYEVKIRRKDGTIFPIEIEGKDTKGKDINFRAAAVRDITERKLAEDALKTSEQELKSIFRAAPTGIGVICDRVIQRVNDRFCEITGYSKDELIGQNARIVYPSDEEYEYVGKEKYIQINQKGTGTVETKMQKKDATIIDVLLSSTPIDLDDLSKGVTFTALDISYRKAKEIELLKSEQKYQTIMESMKEPLYIGSQDFIIQYMNPAMIKRTGHDATGEFCFKAIHDLDERCSWCHIKGLTDNNTHELDIVSPKDNHSFHISVTPIVNNDGSISSLNVLRDVTEFKKMEINLQQAQKMDSIGTLAGGIAHDFNNILGAIIGYTEMARDDSHEGSSVANDLNKVLEASGRAADLVKQILAFSRQGATEYVPIQPASIVKKSIEMLRPTLPTTIKITQDIAPETGLIFADPTQIHQILMNLCTNAFHAMEKTGGKLDISVKEIDLSTEDLTREPHIEAGTFIQLSVSDSGAGIPLEVRDKIFDPYFTTKEVGKGTGLGLSIIHGIVKSYGGFITLYSEPDQGTIFHVFLPIITKEMLPDEKAIEAIKHLPVGGKNILFIDDEDILAELGKDMLERLGYYVTVRKSSLEALETFQNQPDQFDLVITDQTMPGMTGVDLARRMLQIRPGIPIILCTGYSSIISEDKAKSIGIKEFALKPLTKKNIAELIRKVLDT